MQQFMTLWIKEFRSYFQNMSAYFVLFVYLFVSIGSAFYFGEYLAMHDTALYALFYAQPVILTVLVPVLTMRSWAEEYRTGTIEFLLTQPISTSTLVLAKFCAVWLFYFAASLLFIPFIIFSAGWLQLDWWNIFSSYAGLWLLLLFYCASGCLISLISKNLILAYLMSFFFLAVWTALPCFYLYMIYNNFLFAEIGLPDILYFVSFAGIFLLLNAVVLRFQNSVQKYKWLRISAFSVLMMICGVFLNLAAYNFFDTKADLTLNKIYTPKPVTEQLLNDVSQKVVIDVYAAKDYINHNADYFHYLQQVQRFLRRYQKISKGMVQVHVTYVEPFSELEENVLAKDLYFETNAAGSRDYLGAVLSIADGRETVIKQFLLQRQPLLERDVDNAIIKLLQPERRKTIGVYIDGMQNLDGMQEVLLGIENDYNVFNISPSMYDFSSKVDTLVLINPKSISPALRYGLDQFVLRGGKMALFFDFYTASQSDITNGEDIQAADFLENWRVDLQTQFTDEGKIDAVFGYNPLGLRLNKAAQFKIDNPAVEVKPFIYGDNGLVGAVMEGAFTSLYSNNPFEQTELVKSMKPFLKQSAVAGKVAVVGDVDFLEAEYWAAENSPDRNPYSVVEKSGNGRAFKALIDYLAGNDIYEKMPVNDILQNLDNISQRLHKNLFSRREVEYKVLQNKIAEQKLLLFENSGEDLEAYERLRQIGAAGRELAENEQKLQNIEYTIKQKYSVTIAEMIAIQVVLIPFIMVVLLWILSARLRNFLIKRLKEKNHV